MAKPVEPKPLDLKIGEAQVKVESHPPHNDAAKKIHERRSAPNLTEGKTVPDDSPSDAVKIGNAGKDKNRA